MTTCALLRPLRLIVLAIALVPATAANADPPLLDDQLALEPGFHIYKAADASLTGESYVMAFDERGRLLVADGKGVRRLIDKDGDQVYDGYETIIESGLGPRGPQGLLVVGDHIYAVGNDGVQLYSGYKLLDSPAASGTPGSGAKMKHERRLGGKFSCGGDHAAHELVYGHDGWIYFVVGDGAGGNKSHVTEKSSPISNPQNASVFRFNLAGDKWECIGTDARNGPNLSMNYLGELFTFDSDLEYLYGLPNYRPVRLNHWTPGARLGWSLESYGHRNYFYDYWPAVLDVGRGTPTWGTIYEHTQLPPKFRDAVIACDYVWKETNARRTGRLCAFPLKREGSQWKAEMVVIADGKPGAKESGKGIGSFALVDVEVAPDGSLMLTGHGQGIWRVFYDESPTPKVKPIVPPAKPLPKDGRAALDELLTIPQPGSAWSRARIAALLEGLGENAYTALHDESVCRRDVPLRKRLQGLRLLSSGTVSLRLLKMLAEDDHVELRAQAAWLLGVAHLDSVGTDAELKLPTLLKLLADTDPFVRRRACESIARLKVKDTAVSHALIKLLADDDRGVCYAAMVALGRLHGSETDHLAKMVKGWRELIRLAAAPQFDGGKAAPETVALALNETLAAKPSHVPDLLEAYRFASRFRAEITASAKADGEKFLDAIVNSYPHADKDVRWEQTRLLGEYARTDAFPKLLEQLEKETDGVTHIHLLRAIVLTSKDATPQQAERLVNRLAFITQTGWHTIPGDSGQKSVYYPGTMRDLLSKLATQHGDAFAAALPQVKPAPGGTSGNLFAVAVYQAVMRKPEGVALAMEQYRKIEDNESRRQLLTAMPRQLKPEHTMVVIDELIATRHDPMAATASGVIVASGLKLKDFGDAAAQKRIVRGLIDQFFKQPRSTRDFELVLNALTGSTRPGFSPQKNTEKLEAMTVAAREFWSDWYRETWREPFITSVAAARQVQPDEKVHAFILSKESAGGNATKGREVYLQVQCFACHGGIKAKQETLFGPSLAGVTKRLKRGELADALVFPSKTVEDRFKATLVETADGDMLSGIITSESDKELTLVTPLGKVHTIPLKQVQARRKHNTSPMPQNLLSALSTAELRDLLAFLEEVE